MRLSVGLRETGTERDRHGLADGDGDADADLESEGDALSERETAGLRLADGESVTLASDAEGERLPDDDDVALRLCGGDADRVAMLAVCVSEGDED